MLFAGFSVSERRPDPVRDRRRRGARQPGRLLDRLRGRLLRPPRPAGTQQADPHQPQAPEMGRRLVRALRRRRPSSSRGCCRSSAPSSRCPPGSRRCRSGASPCCTVARLASPGSGAGADRRSGRRQLGGLARTTSTTSTTSSLAAIVAGVVYLLDQAPARRRTGREPRRADRPAALERPAAAIPAGRALALGIVQGPAELLPVSSSAHIVLVPWLAGWDWEEIDPEVRKSFEVALHAGAAAALLIGQRRLIAEELRELRPPPGAAAGPLLPAGGDRRLHAGAPDRAAPRRPAGDRLRPARRGRGDGGRRPPAAAARARRGDRGRRAGARRRPGGGAGARASPATASPSPRPAGARFSRDQANLLSRTIALPIIVGATGLKGARLRRRGVAAASCAARWRSASAPPSPRPSPRSG